MMNKVGKIFIIASLNCVFVGYFSYASIKSIKIVSESTSSQIFSNNKQKFMSSLNLMRELFFLHNGKNHGWFGEKRPKIKAINVSGKSEYVDDDGILTSKYVSLTNITKDLLKKELNKGHKIEKWVEKNLVSLDEYNAGIRFTTIYSEESEILEGNSIIKESKFDKLNLNVPIKYDEFIPSSYPQLAYKLSDLKK